MRERNYGIDALRIVSMYMVVVLHILGRGGVLNAAPRGSTNYVAAWFLETAAYCAVNCYALISGYVGINSRYSYKSIVNLWLRAVFYMASITAFSYIFFPELVTMQEIRNIFFPVTKDQYWYFTAYAGLFILMPILNTAINKLEKEQLKKIIILCILFFSVSTTIWEEDPFRLNGGYSPWWLLLLYLIGGYISRFDVLSKVKSRYLCLGYAVMIILSWGYKIVLEHDSTKDVGTLHSERLIRYTSPTILLSGIFLLLIFKNLKTNEIAKKVIKFIAPSAFSVYLIHTQPIIWIHKFTDRFVKYASYPVVKEIIAVLITAMAIFVVGVLIDFGRRGILFTINRIKVQITNNKT